MSFCGRYLLDSVTSIGRFVLKKVSKAMMQKVEKEISILLCKIEKIFPFGWLNVMQYLLVHLPWKLGLEDLGNSGGCIIRKEN
jgi:hypothetical protein